jgi:type VI secretion system secreted protein Hcp
MAFDAFLRVDGIEGESTDKDHRGWIEIIDFGFLVRQSASASASTAGGAGSERADFADFLIRKQIDRASPLGPG